jgi:predicted HAD superfamily Cof-like phosphohydrolase
MNKEQKQVKEWHERFGVVVKEKPTVPTVELQDLRYSLIDEELDELFTGFRLADTRAIADALGDLLYVVYGTAVSCGIDLEPIFQEIHRSNMSKGDPEVVRASNGKILKSRNWTPPNLKPILEAQGATFDEKMKE